MFQPRLTLLPFAEMNHSSLFEQQLEQLGYDVVQSTIDSEQQPVNTVRDRALVLLLAQKQLPRQQIMAFLLSHDIVPSIAVMDTSVSLWEDAIVSRCDEFTCWPCGEQELTTRINRLSQGLMRHSIAYDPEKLSEEFLRFNLIGESPQFLDVLKTIKRVSQCDAPVLIEGETGTGKELAARAIHYLGARKDYPFIPVNCGALPDSLIENELFGHAKGAYTDAREQQCGLVEQANNGTLFFDEIDSLSVKAQVTLLRFLQDKKYQRLGGQSFCDANVRIIAASNRPLMELVEQGVFRRDLYFRLDLMRVDMPPLQQRPGDVAVLAQYFVQRYREHYQQANKRLHPSMLDYLAEQNWTGNVRHLENEIHRAFLMSDGDIIYCDKHRGLQDIDHTADKQLINDMTFSTAKLKVVTEFERQYLDRLMAETHGNVTLAAKISGKERRCLDKLLKKHSINKQCYRI